MPEVLLVEEYLGTQILWLKISESRTRNKRVKMENVRNFYNKFNCFNVFSTLDLDE